MKAYRVKGWAAIYENNRSRTVKELRWVPVPNKFDGEGFKRVMQHDRASDIFAGFILLLQVASRCQPRGTLIRDGRPHDASSLALKTGGRREWFEIALEVLSAPEIGWLEVFEVPDNQVIARDCHRPVSQPAADCHRPVSQVTMNGREGMEGDGMPPAKLSEAEIVKYDGALKRAKIELQKLGSLNDHDKGSKNYKRIGELRVYIPKLLKILGLQS